MCLTILAIVSFFSHTETHLVLLLQINTSRLKDIAEFSSDQPEVYGDYDTTPFVLSVNPCVLPIFFTQDTLFPFAIAWNESRRNSNCSAKPEK